MLYFLLMVCLGIVFLVLAHMIGQGNTSLIHEYHQRRVTKNNLSSFGKDFSKGMYSIGISMILSAVLSLAGLQTTIYLAILILGIAYSLFMIFQAEKKYNGGIF